MTGKNHAVVVGASMGGLLAARSLADFFEEVTLIERDAFPPLGEQRKGVPQGRHTHALLLRGNKILESFFPGLTADLVARGAVLMDRPERDLIWYDGGGYHASFNNEDGKSSALGVGRPLLEGYVRQRLLDLPNVKAIENCDALGLVASERGGRIRGVRILRRAEGSAEEVLEADLVVDAGGRSSPARKWLEAIGYPLPEEKQVAIDIAYSTRLYRRRREHAAGAGAIVITATPELKRGGVMLAQEGDRWIVSLSGFASDRPPLDDEGFLAYARSLAAPDIYNVIKDAEPLSNPMSYRFKSSLRRHYEKLRRFPEGFLVIGDSICSFNPVYGQGMSVAAMEALGLQQELRKGTDGLWRRFFRRAARDIDNPWQIVVNSDLRFPEVEGKRTYQVRFVNAYLARLHRAAHRNPDIARAYNEVVVLVAPPKSLMRPDIFWRVLWEGRRSKSKPGFLEEKRSVGNPPFIDAASGVSN